MVVDNPYTSEKANKFREQILNEYSDTVFSNIHNPNPPIRGPHGEATIELIPGVTPSNIRPYRIQGERLDAWKKLIDQLILDGKLEDSVSPWSSPSFPVATKTPGKSRLVVDFRLLNEATITDTHPLPLIECILNKQANIAYGRDSI